MLFNNRNNSYLESICEYLQEYPDKADAKQFFKVFGQC